MFNIKMSLLPPPEKRDQVIYWAVLGAAVIVIAYFVAGYLVAVYNDATDEQILALDTGQKAPKHATDDASIKGWKTYRNEKYGFEVRYPAELAVEVENLPESGDGDLLFAFKVHDASYKAPPGALGAEVRNDYRNVEFRIYGLSDARLAKEKDKVVRDSKEGLSSERNLQVADKTVKVHALWSGLVGSYHYSYFTDSGVVFTAFSYQGELIETILSTFKFIEPVDTSRWKTYRNEKYGFEVKYPLGWAVKEYADYVGFRDPEWNQPPALEGDTITFEIFRANTEQAAVQHVGFLTRDQVDPTEFLDRKIPVGKYFVPGSVAGPTTVLRETTIASFRALSADVSIRMYYKDGGYAGAGEGEEILLFGNGTFAKIDAGPTGLLNQILSTFKFIEPK